MSQSPKCAICDGRGVLERRERHEWRDKNGDLQGATTSLSSELCACRKSLPPREGKAQWWTLEPVYSADVSFIPSDVVTVPADVEVPVSADNYRVVRAGNRYFPTLITLDAEHVTLDPHHARQVAAALIACAEQCEAIDAADSAPCGHWSPCDCASRQHRSAHR